MPNAEASTAPDASLSSRRLAAATRRAADAADARAARAESDAVCWHDLERDLAVALGRVADLEAVVTGLHRQLAEDTTATASPPGLNRQALRVAERDRRRPHH
ncbi:MAG TPA: hypothetical protein VGP46_04470 [Acidimicrobiales bacterium]|nr:hypothetical protein [Acidimicrobiales bacterium]